ncbi:MAG: hypothetical protein ACF8CQ_06765, partial [Rhodopirellula sp. JB044]|uniref:hypothetical protein n=1 Tax=Rhodopirellula sp. JB044 TaxID=3342844 RepID=UPI00370AAF29
MAVPFSVRCVSCHGRLKVTDESLVGAIVACPRCGSMVQIAEPEQTAGDSPTVTSTPPTTPSDFATPRQPKMVVGDEAVDSEEMTRSDMFGDAEMFADEPGVDPRSQPLPDPETASGQADHSGPPPVETPSVESPQPETDATLPADEHTDWETDGNWASEPKRRRQKMLLMGASGVGGLVVLAILAMWLFGGDPAPDTIAMQPPGASAPPAGENTDSSTHPDSTVQGETVAPAPQERTDDGPTNNAIDDVLNETTTAPVDSNDPDFNDSDSDDADTSDTLGGPADSLATPLPGMGGPIPTDLLPDDILAGQTPTTNTPPDTSLPGADPERANVDESNAPLMEMPAGLEAFTQLLDLPGNAPDAPPTMPQSAPAEELMIESAADAMLDPMLLATPPPEVNIDNVMKFRVAIQSEGYPLSSFVLVCSEITQVPIQLDWVALDLAGISLAQSVQDRVPGWKPIGELLGTITKELGLVIEKDENRLLVTIGKEDLTRRLGPVIAFDDFGDEADSVKQWVDEFVEQTEWEERERIGLRALVTDCLRAARGMPQKLDPSALSHWSITAECLSGSEPASEDSDVFPDHWPLLEGGESGAQLDTAIALAGLLRKTARDNRATCIVNWDDARQRRLSPGQLVLPYANQPAGKMLSQSLAPMGLQTRVAD